MKSSKYTISQLKEMKNVDFVQFTQDELTQFGFSNFFLQQELMLAPKWIFEVMIPGTTLTSINGETKTFGSDKIDLDTRFGITAWGLTKSQLRDSKITNLIDESTETNQ